MFWSLVPKEDSTLLILQHLYVDFCLDSLARFIASDASCLIIWTKDVQKTWQKYQRSQEASNYSRNKEYPKLVEHPYVAYYQEEPREARCQSPSKDCLAHLTVGVISSFLAVLVGSVDIHMAQVWNVINGYAYEDDDANRFNETEFPAHKVDHRHHLQYYGRYAARWQETHDDVLCCQEQNHKCKN